MVIFSLVQFRILIEGVLGVSLGVSSVAKCLVLLE